MSDFSPLTTAEQLLAAAAREGLHLTADTVALDAMGLDFLVVHGRDAMGVDWIVRTPRRFAVVAAAAREAQTLRHIARALPVAVPDWQIHAPDVIAYPRLQGTPVITLPGGEPTWAFDPAAPPAAFLDSLAELLVALQAIPAAGTLREVSPAAERAQLAAAIAVGTELLAPSPGVVARWQRWLAASATWPAHVALAHADLHPGHLLVDASHRITGVLDWTEAAVTDPATDFAMIAMCFPQGGVLEAVIDRFAARGGRVWPGLAHHAVERAAAFPALGAWWAQQSGGNEAVLAHCKAQLAALE